jgi:protein O-GlcNAc transferase
MALLELERPADALLSFEEALTIKPDYVEALSNRGAAFVRVRRPKDALASVEKALTIRPDYVEALNGRGNALLDLKRPDDALASYDKALAIQPGYGDALNNRGTALLALKRPEDALASYDEALTIKPHSAEAHNNRGNALLALRRPEDALADYDKALAIKSDYAEAHNNRGSALRDLKRPEDALASYDKALAIEPNSAEILNNRGTALFDLRQYNGATAAYQAVLAIEPGRPDSLAMLERATSLSCNWAGFTNIKEKLRVSIQEGSFNGTCFGVLSAFDDPSLQRKAAEGHCMHMVGAWTKRAGIKIDASQRRLRVGYLSADFGAHPVAFLMTGLIEAHDRSFCEVYGFSASADDDSPQRKRLVGAFDHFIDVTRLSDEALYEEIRKAGIDVIIDLGGHTKDSRLLALARRAAPIQISYLGYPGSTGAPFVDYILADDFVVPKEAAQYYTEKVVHLPNCFQANDRQRLVATAVPTRTQCGLPERGFVFGAFHGSYKINPEVFDVWMRLLQGVPDSVIWIAAEAAAHENLRWEAAARCVDPGRLVFADPVPYPEHLARQKLADLFIDAWPYNGGTTASDALWVGLPVLTLAGRSYAARMAGSLLRAIGLPELITYSPAAYEALALRLAKEPALLNAVRQKLSVNIATTPLFDTIRFTRHIEAAYAKMWEIYQQGESPQGFSVRSVDDVAQSGAELLASRATRCVA